MKARFKAFILATVSLAQTVSFGRRRRARIEIQYSHHKLLVGFLRLFFDVRMTPKGKIWIEMRKPVSRKRTRFAIRRFLKQQRQDNNAQALRLSRR